MTFPSIMEESVNEEHENKNENITGTSIYHTKKGKWRTQNITPPTIMEEFEYMINMDNNENETETNLDNLDKEI